MKGGGKRQEARGRGRGGGEREEAREKGRRGGEQITSIAHCLLKRCPPFYSWDICDRYHVDTVSHEESSLPTFLENCEGNIWEGKPG